MSRLVSNRWEKIHWEKCSGTILFYFIFFHGDPLGCDVLGWIWLKSHGVFCIILQLEMKDCWQNILKYLSLFILRGRQREIQNKFHLGLCIEICFNNSPVYPAIIQTNSYESWNTRTSYTGKIHSLSISKCSMMLNADMYQLMISMIANNYNNIYNTVTSDVG